MRLFDKSIKNNSLTYFRHTFKIQYYGKLWINSLFEFRTLKDFSNKIIIDLITCDKIKIYKIFKLIDTNYFEEKIITTIKRKLISRSADKYELQIKMRGWLDD